MTVTYPRKFRDQLSAQDILNQVVLNREIHMVTLNRYRFSEQRSCKDLTDVIERLNGEPRQLCKELSHHVSDEARHAYWLTDLLYELNEPIGTPPGTSYVDEFERLLDRSVHENPEDILIDALAAINVTEKRGCEYFSAHIKALKALPSPENDKIRETIEMIMPEEAAHVRWGNAKLAEIAKKSPQHRERVENAKRKYTAIEQAAFESGMDVLAGAELRRVNNLMKVVDTLPLWQRPQYLMEHLPQTLFSPKLQKTRIDLVQKAWERDPIQFVEKFIPMFFSANLKATQKAESN
ncbi:ferritin-like domain-containing protein [Tumidithrix elongata RA019]|uniref:Ferritin-like domain-containing protein n=1 Tax=Tumidithrix elongata BACA0141 TaxID=2716417 RepID=A0AAW9Q2V9_9CYAN|nr:ferritin-like domain-containing protein [Tumidithrix elongata RA019]